MTVADKTLDRMRDNPRDWRIENLLTVAGRLVYRYVIAAAVIMFLLVLAVGKVSVSLFTYR